MNCPNPDCTNEDCLLEETEMQALYFGNFLIDISGHKGWSFDPRCKALGWVAQTALHLSVFREQGFHDFQEMLKDLKLDWIDAKLIEKLANAGDVLASMQGEAAQG